MKVLKILMFAGLILAVTGTAGAVSGFTALASRNQDMGSVYVYTNFATAVAQSGTPGSLTNTTKIAATGAIGNEDTWGIALLYYIAPGTPVGYGLPGTTVNPTGAPATYYNGDGSNGTWLTAIFYGGVDQKVIMSPGLGSHGENVVNEDVYSAGLQFKLYAVSEAALAAADAAAGNQAPNATTLLNYIDNVAHPGDGRTAQDAYAGWVGPSVGGTLLLTGTSTYFHTTFQVEQDTGQINNGVTNCYFDVPADPTNNTAWNNMWNTGQLLSSFDNQAPAGTTGVVSDVWLNWTINNSTNNWDVYSKDFGGADIIPEPLTMLGLFLSIGGVAGYIRRRRMAVV